MPNQFLATAVVQWQLTHGRHNLPWQNTRDPYRVWLSEIMLQQTQVVTVLDYFSRFTTQFPDVLTLAKAPLDEVLGYWSGLGYYSRARHMHRCAQTVVNLYAGQFPQTAEQLQTLPGIGPSTAAAIASLCFDERVAILDGNVKRVLTRFLGFGADLSVAANERQLWQAATALLPDAANSHHMQPYTQGMMDLGATVCKTRQPKCDACPLAPHCVAQTTQRQTQFPVKTRKLKRTAESFWVLLARNPEGAVWLEQRPEKGVWAGLYCLPLFGSFESLLAALPSLQQEAVQVLPAFKHVLTHKDMHLHPVQIMPNASVDLDISGRWVSAAQWPHFGLPAPVTKLLQAS